ncbi:MAG: TldD/PmbA family protein [Gemmatimonadetes bacterium]|nr:TldD/PmbA family protein [Gemmatimonadota bacterium]
MIATLLEQAARRTDGADAARKTDETTTLRLSGGRVVSAQSVLVDGVNLRVLRDGRVGTAGTTGDDPEDLLARALASAEGGEAVPLQFPGLARGPSVVTHVPRAATASVADLASLATMLRDRLAPDRAELEIVVERSLGSVEVANTAGANASWDVSLVTLALEAARVRDGRRFVTRAHLGSADLPSLPELEMVVAQVRQRLAWSERPAEVAAGRQNVLFLPSALPVLLVPVEQALTGREVLRGGSPLARRRGTPTFSAAVTLTDDPLAPARPGSRPFDDEGVPSKPLTLINAGVVEGLLYDLETAARVGTAPTGHGRRTTFGKPQPACSNVVLAPGEASFDQLLEAVGEGILVESLRGPFPVSAAGGTFAQVAGLAWKVANGEVQGLIPELTLAGNAHDLLARVALVGRDATWLGARSAPALVVEGVSVF